MAAVFRDENACEASLTNCVKEVKDYPNPWLRTIIVGLLGVIGGMVYEHNR